MVQVIKNIFLWIKRALNFLLPQGCGHRLCSNRSSDSPVNQGSGNQTINNFNFSASPESRGDESSKNLSDGKSEEYQDLLRRLHLEFFEHVSKKKDRGPYPWCSPSNEDDFILFSECIDDLIAAGFLKEAPGCSTKNSRGIEFTDKGWSYWKGYKSHEPVGS